METLEGIKKLTKDIKLAAYTLSQHEARFLVDAYYQMQDNRIRTDGQIRATLTSGEPNAVLSWLTDQNYTLEKQVGRALDAYSGSHPVGQWMRAQKGVGPIISAGLLAHIDIKKCPAAGNIWSFAGLNSNIEWRKSADIEAMIKEHGKGLEPYELACVIANKLNRKPDNIFAMAKAFAEGEAVSRADVVRALKTRPFNAKLKVLCYKIGESFVKVCNYDDAVYGHLYVKRKQQEITKNEALEFKDQADKALKHFSKSTESYKWYAKGMLPPAHIHARAKRYAVQIFLSHLHHVWYLHEFGKEPPKPFAIEHLGHKDYIAPIL